MSDITLRYGSTGFEKVASELASLEKQAGGSASWFAPMQKTLKEAESSGSSFTKTLSTGLSSVMSVAGGVAVELAKIGTAVVAVAGVVTGVGVAAFTSWSVSVLKTTESFRMLETSLYGATKSWQAVNTVSQFAKEYAATYPAMYRDIMQAMQSFAYIPALKPMIERGDVKQMKEMMDVVQALMTMRPEQGVQGAIYALREALAGNWRSLMYRFDVPIKSIAQSAGMTMEQMKESPEAAARALKAWTTEFVGAETMSMMAKNLSIQVGNLRDKYEMWLDRLGKTGIYDKVVGYVLKLNDVFENLLKSERFQKISDQLNSFMEKIADRVAGIFTKGVNWESITDLKSLLEVFRKIGQNAMDALRDAWEVAKGPVSEALKSVLTFGAQVAIDAAKDLFLPVGRSIASGISEGLKEGMKEHPIETMLVGAAGGAYMGKGFGPKGMLIGAALGAEAVALPAQIEAVKGWWQSYSKFMGGVEETIKDMLGMGRKPERFIAKEWTGPRPWRKVEEAAVTPPQAGWIQEWVRGYTPKVATPWQMGAEERFAQYGAWSRMAGMLAQAPEEAAKSARYRFAVGEIPFEEFKRQQKIEDFRAEQMKRLETIAGMPGAGPEVRGKVFGEMFNVAYQQGDWGKAQEFMNKSLEEMVESMKKQAGVAEKDSGNLSTIADNTGRMADHLDKLSPPESRSRTTKSEAWSEDELRYQVSHALGEA